MEYKTTRSVNYWEKFWYVTALPGGVGFILTIIGLIAGLVGLTVTGLTVMSCQVAALLYWYFTTKGDPAAWTIILIGGEMVDYFTAQRFMCPRFGTLLAIIDTSVRLRGQAVIGKRGKGLETAQEVGSELPGFIRYFRMEGVDTDGKKLPFPEHDPMNIDIAEAMPEITFQFCVEDPRLVKRLEVTDTNGEVVQSGVRVAIGQIAEEVRAGYQDAVAGRSMAWVPFHLEEAEKKVRTWIVPHLKLRGITMDDEARPSINHYGQPEAIDQDIAGINAAKLQGDKEVKRAEKEAKAAEHQREKTVIDADARAKSTKLQAEADATRIQRTGEAQGVARQARIQPLIAAKLTHSQIGEIERQTEVKSGLPANVPGMRDVIYGEIPELWRGLGDDSGSPTPAAAAKTKATDGGSESPPDDGAKQKKGGNK